MIITVPERVSYLESSETAYAMALFPCTCHTVSHLPTYSVLLNAPRPLRPVATFSIVDDIRQELSLRRTLCWLGAFVSSSLLSERVGLMIITSGGIVAFTPLPRPAVTVKLNVN